MLFRSGQNQWEEVNVLPAATGGQNLGWNLMESMHCYGGSGCVQWSQRAERGLDGCGAQPKLHPLLLRGSTGAGLFHPKRKARLVNVTVETLAPCKKLVRIELDEKSVETAFENTTNEFQRGVSLPGFRAGKAPRHMVLQRHAADIEQEIGRASCRERV